MEGRASSEISFSNIEVEHSVEIVQRYWLVALSCNMQTVETVSVDGKLVSTLFN